MNAIERIAMRIERLRNAWMRDCAETWRTLADELADEGDIATASECYAAAAELENREFKRRMEAGT
jgi:hypothetical protein